jgi:hypothetical protein
MVSRALKQERPSAERQRRQALHGNCAYRGTQAREHVVSELKSLFVFREDKAATYSELRNEASRRQS